MSVPQEDEHDPEDQRQRRALEFFTFLIVGEVDSALLRPSLHAHGKRWKRILTDRAVQSFVKLDAEVSRFVAEGRETAFGHWRRCQEGQERQPVSPEQTSVQLQPLACWSG